MSSYQGGCLCGAVRFDADLSSLEHGACHCSMCRRWSSGPLLATTASSVSFTGEENIGRYPSSDWAERGFCKKCGANLFYHMPQAGGYVMSIGCFDNSADFRLTSEIFVDNKPEGYTFAGDHPRLTEKETLEKFTSCPL